MGVEYLAYIATSLGSAALAIVGYRWTWSRSLKNQRGEIELEHQKKISNAELTSKRLIDEAQLDILRKQTDIELREKELQHSLQQVENQKREIEKSEQSLLEQKEQISKLQIDAKSTKQLYEEKLLSTGNLSIDEVKSELVTQVEENCAEELKSLQQSLRDRTESEIEAAATDLLITAMQRISTNPAVEASATIVDLPSEDMKGRIIGREGRNIRSFEAVTGTTLMIDETPDSVLISAFDPVKREIARLALESLLKDGRIHPSTIEAAYDSAKTDVLKNVKILGEESMTRLKLKPAHPEILKLLGQLHFRLSLNQNSLEHSIEVAYIASMLASELGLDPVIAKRAALFHDLGKAMDHEYEGSHAMIAGKMLRRHNEDSRVVNAVEASHEEVPPESVYAPLVTIADRISAMRPGARCDSLDSYVDRVKSLEELAKDFDGVKEAFALQAGREIRIVVEPTQIGDEEARELARKIRREIEETMNYPSTIKITVIREQRFCETAK